MDHPLQRFVTAVGVILTLLSVLVAPAPGQQATASVAGRVTVDGRALANTQVLLAAQSKDDSENVFLARLEAGETRKVPTDSEGRYRFNDVAAGSYQVKVFAPTLVADKSGPGIRVSEGETVEGVDFALKSGGVITGSVTLSDGRPAIRQEVRINPVAPAKDVVARTPAQIAAEAARQNGSATTDDRGVYRIYGVAPGDYLVSVTHGSVKKESVETFYPGAADKTKAVAVKVKAGGETTGIDLKLGLSKKKGYEVRGRVIDESGKGISGVMISYAPAHDGQEDGTAPSPVSALSGMAHSNAQGEFKIPGVTQGKYTAGVMSMFDEASVYSDPATFEVADRDIDGVEIKTHKGLTASGAAVLEGNDDPAVMAQLSQVQLMGTVMKSEQFSFSVSKANIGPDGSFVMRGLSPGKLILMVNPLLPNNRFAILRIERGGALQSDGVELSPDNSVTDIKLVLGYGNCTIYGKASIEGGSLRKGSTLYVQIRRDREAGPLSEMSLGMGMGNSPVGRTLQISPGENFRAEGLVPGDYEITLTTLKYLATPNSGDNSGPDSASQKVTLTSGGALEVNLKLDVSSAK